jgi:methyl-accepting chemotaxis protein
MAFLSNLRMRFKALLLVAIAVVIAVVMFVVSNVGLSNLKTSLDELVLATNVERHVYETLAQEKAYLLNANAATRDPKAAAEAARSADEHLGIVVKTLDEIDRFGDPSSTAHAAEVRKGGTEYADLYHQAVAALVEQDRLTVSLEQDGEAATQQARSYIQTIGDGRKTAIAQEILEYTYLIRANEKRYMLYQKAETFDAMNRDFASMMKKIVVLESSVDNDRERAQVATFKKAAAGYEAAAHKWVEGNDRLFKQILPKMRQLGQTGLTNAYQAAEAQQAAMNATRQKVITTLIVAAIVISALGILLGLLVSNAISRPITALSGRMTEMAGGDLATTVPNTAQADEIGDMARTVEQLRLQLDEAEKVRAEHGARAATEKEAMAHRLDLGTAFVTRMQELAAGFAQSSNEVSDAAKNLSATAEETARQAQSVAAAAEQASSNVQTVASSSEEMATSVREITGQVSHSADVADAASQEAEQSNQRITQLASAAAAIGDVVNLISNIAGQTNLLALNATIEAARAGEAGKGFAVVAAEVKQLATQTERATQDIGAKVTEIQHATDGTVKSMTEIIRTITDIKEIASSIAGAVEEQGAATDEIARNCQQAAVGTQQVTSNIAGVGQAAEMTGAASTQLMQLSNGLSGQAADLRRAVDDFMRDLNAA